MEIDRGIDPGGKPEYWEALDLSIEANSGLFTICMVAALLALLAIILYVAKVGYLHAIKERARSRVAENQARAMDRIAPLATRLMPRKRGVRPYQATVIAIMATACLFLVVALRLHSFDTAQARPIVYYSPNEFALWIANSPSA